MTPSKRVMDLLLALVLCVLLVPVIVVIALAVLMVDGRPVFYRSERMKAPDQAFTLWKFRTMTQDAADHGVTAGYKQERFTRLGRRLRRFRLDELPQLWNILRGDMSFVGPRPPLRRYVEMRPDLYASVLQNRPGVTGLATLTYHHCEEMLLARCTCAEETDALYLQRCVPVKARLDMIWAKNRSICYDIKLILDTVKRVFGPRKRLKNRQNGRRSA